MALCFYRTNNVEKALKSFERVSERVLHYFILLIKLLDPHTRQDFYLEYGLLRTAIKKFWCNYRIEQVRNQWLADFLNLENSDISDRLTQELLAVNPQSPETWTAIGMYCEMKGKSDHAMVYYDRVRSDAVLMYLT